MKKAKIIYLSSFIPFILMFVRCIIAMKAGIRVGFFGNLTEYYGLDAYTACFLFSFFNVGWLCFLGIGTLMQIVMLVILTIKKKSIQKFVFISFAVYTLPVLLYLYGSSV